MSISGLLSKEEITNQFLENPWNCNNEDGFDPAHLDKELNIYVAMEEFHCGVSISCTTTKRHFFILPCELRMELDSLKRGDLKAYLYMKHQVVLHYYEAIDPYFKALRLLNPAVPLLTCQMPF